jgi:hypothetical protein
MVAKQGNRGVVKVLDFGLAKVTSEGARRGMWLRCDRSRTSPQRPLPNPSETAGAGPVPMRTAVRPAPVTASPGSKPGSTPRSGPTWQSLVDIKETGGSPAPAPAAASNRRRRWLWPAAAFGVLLLGLIAVWATGVIKIKTPEGYIVLRDLPDQAMVLVDGKKATVRWPTAADPRRSRWSRGSTWSR